MEYSDVILYFVAQHLDSRDHNFRTLLISSGQKDEQYSRDLGQKSHRGQRGRVLNGFIAQGQTYGYTYVPVEDPTRKGDYGRPFVEAVNLVINPKETAVVRRIFELHVSGVGYRRIAIILNEEGIPSPLKGSLGLVRLWQTSTIRKMLSNDKYRGLCLWNRTKTVMNPYTGRKEQNPRPEDEWDRISVPNWRIISDELWDANCATTARRRETEADRS